MSTCHVRGRMPEIRAWLREMFGATGARNGGVWRGVRSWMPATEEGRDANPRIGFNIRIDQDQHSVECKTTFG